MTTAPAYTLPRSAPGRQGVQPEAVLAFLEALESERERLAPHSLMIVKQGHIVAEGWWAPYGPAYPHLLNSLSKSFTATAIGLAADEQLLTLDQRVLSFFPEYATDSVSRNIKDLRIRHLLAMSTGHREDTALALWGNDSDDWVKTFLETQIEDEPGTRFVYNTGATYMLSAILEKAAGEKLLDYLRPRLFDPLGIAGVTTVSCPRGIHAGGYGMSMTTEDIAKFGQLYLQRGLWNGRRILSESWIRSATEKQVSNDETGAGDWAQGYGFQFWRCRHGAYRGDGAFGQFCIVMPEQEAVVAMTAGTPDMQAVLDLVWTHLLPGLKREGASLADDTDQEDRLSMRLKGLTYLSAAEPGRCPPEWGQAPSVYLMEPNSSKIERVAFTGDDRTICIRLSDDRGEHVLQAGLSRFREGHAELSGFGFRYAANGVWHRPDELTIDLHFTELPFYDRFVCRFDGDSVHISSCRSVPVAPVLSDMAGLPEMRGTRV